MDACPADGTDSIPRFHITFARLAWLHRRWIHKAGSRLGSCTPTDLSAIPRFFSAQANDGTFSSTRTHGLPASRDLRGATTGTVSSDNPSLVPAPFSKRR